MQKQATSRYQTKTYMTFFFPIEIFLGTHETVSCGSGWFPHNILRSYIYYTGVTAILEFVAYIPDISTERNISYFFQNLPSQNKSWPLGNARINWKKTSYHLSSRASLIELLEKLASKISLLTSTLSAFELNGAFWICVTPWGISYDSWISLTLTQWE